MAALDALPFALKRRTLPVPIDARVSSPSLCLTKKLKRMPHLFARVLELPFHGDTPVKVIQSRDSFTFVVRLPGLVAEEVKAEVMEIVPGATKVVIRGSERLTSNIEIDEVDLWRFRLPSTARPEGSVASYENGMLSVTIPMLPGCCEDKEESTREDDGDPDILLHGEESVQEVERNGHLDTKIRCSEFPDCENSEAESDEERIQRELLDDLDSFSSPRQTTYRAGCAQSATDEDAGSQDFFRSLGSWVHGFAIFV